MAGSKGESEKGVMMAKENVKNFYEAMELVGGGLDGVCVLIGSSMDFEQSADASYQKGAHACAFLGVGFGYW